VSWVVAPLFVCVEELLLRAAVICGDNAIHPTEVRVSLMMTLGNKSTL
jgi:hypothetical protein